MKDLLEDRDELLTDLGRGANQDREEPLSKPRFLFPSYCLVLWEVLAGGLASCDVVLEVGGRYSRALVRQRGKICKLHT